MKAQATTGAHSTDLAVKALMVQTSD